MDPVERKIATKLVATLIAKGYNLSVFDSVHRSTDAEAVIAALGTTDDDKLRVYRGVHRIGFIWLIWGNGEELISDCSDVPEIVEVIDNV